MILSLIGEISLKNIMENIMILVNNVNFGQNPETGFRKFY